MKTSIKMEVNYMKKIVIFGSGCHAKVVFSEIIKLKKYNIIGFVDNFVPKKKLFFFRFILHLLRNFRFYCINL